jgi:hypothetical protein
VKRRKGVRIFGEKIHVIAEIFNLKAFRPCGRGLPAGLARIIPEASKKDLMVLGEEKTKKDLRFG